jgi:hypothetical protein
MSKVDLNIEMHALARSFEIESSIFRHKQKLLSTYILF